MRLNRVFVIGLIVIVSVVVVVIVTLALTPQETNPAFAAATQFMEAAGAGDDTTAFSLLSDPMQRYVRANCANGSPSACIAAYAPPEWGDFLGVVFRRAAPDGDDAWNVDLIATYERDKGGSGVCIYQRMERNKAGEWLVARWGGFIACADGRSRNMATNPDTPNRAP